MSFKEKLLLNREAYFAAKADNKSLNIEVATRNNTKNIIIAKYDVSSGKTPNKANQRR